MALRFFLGLSNIWRTAWDRDEVSFAPVEPIHSIRYHYPSSAISRRHPLPVLRIWLP